MDIQTLGNLGEFIGSLAVLVTLIYLAIQTRQTVTIARQTSLSDIPERRQELMAVSFNQPGFLHWRVHGQLLVTEELARDTRLARSGTT